MKQANFMMLRAGACLKSYKRAIIFGLALVCIALAPASVSGQWTGGPTGPVYYNGGNVGIGTTNPQGGVHVATAPTWSAFNFGPSVIVDGSRNNVLALLDSTHSNPWAIGSIGPLQISVMPALGDTTTPPWAIVTMLRNGNVGIGTSNPQYLLSVNGTMGVKDVIVTNTGWSDYVFRPDYRLRPLSEVNAYIQQHRHLPDIPSEAEVKETGISLGDMQAKLLAKVEELTLHMIQADERNNRLEQQNQDLREYMTQQERLNQELSKRLAQLESQPVSISAPADR